MSKLVWCSEAQLGVSVLRFRGFLVLSTVAPVCELLMEMAVSLSAVS